jgi:hypothetical protein
VTKDGLGLILIGQSNNWAYDWMVTTVGEVLPLGLLTPLPNNKPASIRITKDNHVLATSLPWSSIGEHGTFPGQSITQAREGAEVIANTGSFTGSSYPFLGWWDVGMGRSLAMMPVFQVGENPFLDWEFFADLCSNLHLYAAKQGIPPDPEIIHHIRHALEWYQHRRGMLVSSIEFIAKMGGNTASIDNNIIQTDQRLSEIRRMYLDYNFEESLSLIDVNAAGLEKAEELTMKVKNRTFLWIYLIEWAVLTSTSLVAGAMIWALMVKRRLYTEVGTTKLTRTPAEPLATPGGDTR